MPPSTAWASTPSGWAAASQTMLRRTARPGRNRHAVTSTSTATTISTPVSIRLVNSIQVCTIGSPLVCAATRLLVVQVGQSGQPSPEALSRTAAPVMISPALAHTPASAIRRIEVTVGYSTGATRRRADRVRSAGTDPS